MGGREEGPEGSGCPIERVRWGAFSTGSWAVGTCTMDVGDSWCWSHTH